MLPFRRDYNAARINRVANDPSVFEEISLPGQEPFELSPLVADLRNILLMTDEGGVLAKWQEPGVYEIHTQFISQYRGVAAIRTIREMFSWLFINTPAMELQSQVPECNDGAKAVARAIGARFEFEREAAWPTRDGKDHAIGYYVLRYSDWLYQPYVAGVFAPLGAEFHDRLEERKLALLAPTEGFRHDLAQDVNAGATLSMIWAGQLDKALMLYNRWARFAGFAEVRLISVNPLIIALQNTTILLNVAEKDFEVLACH